MQLLGAIRCYEQSGKEAIYTYPSLEAFKLVSNDAVSVACKHYSNHAALVCYVIVPRRLNVNK